MFADDVVLCACELSGGGGQLKLYSEALGFR